jgi:hypothetical protein
MPKPINVLKADGTLQPFEKRKIVGTCLRLRATPEIAGRVADMVESKVYEGIPTKDVMRMIFTYLKRYRPSVGSRLDLRTAISLLRPKPDFELYVRMLLREYGYKVKPNTMVPGRCIDHEVDAIAEKDGDVFYVEVKHHFKAHTFTPLGVFLEAWATFEDIIDGYRMGRHNKRFNRALVVTNTKLSDYARRYAECKKIGCISWDACLGTCLSHTDLLDLEDMIEEKDLFPVTLIRGLDMDAAARLGDAGILTLRQLLESEDRNIRKSTGLPLAMIGELRDKAERILLK